MGLLCPEVIRDLRLHEYGLRIVERRALNFLPGTDGSYLLTRAGQIREGIARISPADAEKYPAYEAQVARVGDFVRSLLLRTPPNVTKFEKRARLPELLKLLRMGSELRSFDKEGLIALHELMTKSAGDYLDRWFESDLVKALFGFDAVVGNYASPYTPGSAYVQLHHTIGGVNGRRGVWGHAIGGMGAITQAMAKAATAAGAEISIGSPVSEVDGRTGSGDGCGSRGRDHPARRIGRIQRHPQAALWQARPRRNFESQIFHGEDQRLSLPLRDVSNERRTVGAAELFSFARTRGG